MASVIMRSYASPALVLLAFDWPDADQHADFLGFSIRRTPGFYHHARSWLPNRRRFAAPEEGKDYPSNEAPIQKFMWWDARIGPEHGDVKQIRYEAWPARGAPGQLQLVEEAKAELAVDIPPHVVNGIGTWFNRAVVSSQAFSFMLREMGLTANQQPTPEQALKLRSWLSAGMHSALVEHIERAGSDKRALAGAIYHLTDKLWTVPALARSAEAGAAIDLVYDARTTKDADGETVPPPTEKAVVELMGKVRFHPRNKTNIMHNKFIVSGRGFDGANPRPKSVLMGSANFTTGGLTSQANLIHLFKSPGLAQSYLERYELLKANPTKGETAKKAGWSPTETLGDAAIRVFFSPEPSKKRDSIETVVRAIHNARSSVMFCLFSPTDEALRQACFAAGDRGLMMFGLVNNIADKEGEHVEDDMQADEKAAIELYHRSKGNRDVIEASRYRWDTKPVGFVDERQLFPGEPRPGFPPVIIHHKLVIIDAETPHPLIYTGSANMSKNSVNNNDENLLEILGSRRLAGIYLAEFLRLYEHYRARAFAPGSNKDDGRLGTTRDAWARKHLKPGTPEFRARLAMTGRLPG
jgi:phosphatidylserine/phosphatidylglycerophosphate/cardiolipin synthase-like enzyme